MITIKSIFFDDDDRFLSPRSKRCSLAQQKASFEVDTFNRRVGLNWLTKGQKVFRDQLQSFKKLLIAIYLWMALIRLLFKGHKYSIKCNTICHPAKVSSSSASSVLFVSSHIPNHFLFSSTGPLCGTHKKRTGEGERVSGQDNGPGHNCTTQHDGNFAVISGHRWCAIFRW